MKWNLSSNQNAIGIEALDNAAERHECGLVKQQKGSPLSHPHMKHFFCNYSSNKHDSRVAFVQSNAISAHSPSPLLEMMRSISCLIPAQLVPQETARSPGTWILVSLFILTVAHSLFVIQM